MGKLFLDFLPFGFGTEDGGGSVLGNFCQKKVIWPKEEDDQESAGSYGQIAGIKSHFGSVHHVHSFLSLIRNLAFKLNIRSD